jgi:hypothetical protein
VEILEIEIVPLVPFKSRQMQSQTQAEEEEISDDKTLRPGGGEEEIHTGEEETFRHEEEFSNCKKVHSRQSLSSEKSSETAPKTALQSTLPIRARPKLKAQQHDIAGASTMLTHHQRRGRECFKRFYGSLLYMQLF